MDKVQRCFISFRKALEDYSTLFSYIAHTQSSAGEKINKGYDVPMESPLFIFDFFFLFNLKTEYYTSLCSAPNITQRMQAIYVVLATADHL